MQDVSWSLRNTVLSVLQLPKVINNRLGLLRRFGCGAIRHVVDSVEVVCVIGERSVVGKGRWKGRGKAISMTEFYCAAPRVQ